MSVLVRIAAVAVSLALLGVTDARAADYCVAPLERPGCTQRDTLADALTAAVDGDRIFLDASPQPGFDDGGKNVRITGQGTPFTSAVTLSAASLDDVHPASLTVTGPAHVSRAQVAGDVVSDSGALRIDDSVVSGRLDAQCGTVDARNVTVEGGVKAACATADGVTLASSAILGEHPFTLSGQGTVTTDYSAHAADPDVTATHWLGADTSPDALVDAGDPAPLAPYEPLYDLAGVPRIADGNADGVLRRDAGAYERQPPATPIPAGSVLTNPDAESTLTGWSGTFTAPAYGSDDFLPSAATAEALGAGSALFSGGADITPSLVQRIDVTASAASIDTGGATATLSGLLGGYGSDPDEVSLQAQYLDPEGNPIGTLAVPGVSAAERMTDTNLLPRSASGPIPARTRFIDVRLGGRRVGDGVYTDAYADNLGLVLSVPGVPVQNGPPDGKPVVPGLKPFAGVTVLTPHMTFGRSGRSHLTLACASATVGACTGTLELRGRLPKTSAAQRIAQFVPFSVAPGRRARVEVVLLVAARKALARRTKLVTTLLAVAHDGQGVQRSRVVPLTIKLPAALPRGLAPGSWGTAGAPAWSMAAR